MTREEAIQKLIFVGDEVTSESQAEAIDMAIEALSAEQVTGKLESVEIPTVTNEESTMSQPNSKLDLISRADALMELNGACSNWQDDAKVAEIIHALPSADRPQGEWVNNEHDMPVCSECGYFSPYDRAIDDYEYGNYCPNCGARMRGAE